MRWPTLFKSAAPDCITTANRLWRRRRRRARWAAFSLVALFGSGFAQATSVTPPSFPELVGEAQMIARGTVTGTEARWVEGAQGRTIKTFVTFAVEKVLKGNPGRSVTLEFLGGTVGRDTLHVGGMPEFKVGQHEILFVQGNGVQFCPLVRFAHGRYHVHTEAKSQREYVTRNDETPLTSTADVAAPVDDHGARAFASSAPALTPNDFETEIAREVRAPHSQP